MPRMDGVSGCSTTCCIRRKPRPRMVCLMPRGQPMKLTTHLIFSVEESLSDLLSVFFLVGVIVFLRVPMRKPALQFLFHGLQPLSQRLSGAKAHQTSL